MSDFEYSDSINLLDTDNALSSSSGDEMDLLQETPEKNKDHSEVTIPEYSNQKFFLHFRVSIEAAERIAEQFAAANYFCTQHAGEYRKVGSILCAQ